MADIELVIKIPEGVKKLFDDAKNEDLHGSYYDYNSLIGKAIRNGTPLPKGHGRLGDLDALNNGLREQQRNYEHTSGIRRPINEAVKDGIIIARTHIEDAKPIIEADKEQKDTYKYLLNGAKSLVKEHPDLVRDIWNCSSCEHTEDECKDCYPELGYKNDKLKRDTEAVPEFVKSYFFKKLMESLDEQDRAAKEDVVQFLRDIKVKEKRK